MLKENINIDWSYTDRVVRQLVDETEIDFKNSRVKLESANFSFPFYSFGSRRAYPENLISEPKSNFGKHVISTYGLDEKEYREVYSMYMGVIAGRLKDHDENVNHLYLHESNYTPKSYAPKWGVRRENNVLDRIVDGLVEESRIEYVEEIVHLGNFSFQLFKAPFATLYSIPETSPFYQHCREIYGLTPEEITYVWREYRNIVRKEMQSNPLSNLISPFNESINESTEDNFLDTIVSQLVDETEIDFEYGMPHISAFPDPGFSIDSSFNLNLDLWENLFGRMFKSFWSHCRNVYGLTDPEIQKVWWEYKKETLKKIDLKRWIIKESTEGNFLDKIVEQLLDETQIFNDRGELRANTPFFHNEWEDMFNMGLTTGIVGGIGLAVLIDSDEHSTNYIDFKSYCWDMYGLTEEECKYVWDKYRSDLYDTDFSHLYTPNVNLNESKKDLNSYVHTVVDKMVDSTHLKYKKTTNTIWVKLPFHIMLNNKGKNIEEVSSTYITSPTARVVAEIRKHLILIYGMDKWETDQAAIMYLSKMTDKIKDYKDKGFDDNWNELNESSYHDYKDPMLSSKSHDLIKKVVDQLMGETQLIFPPQPPVQDTMEKNYRGGFIRAPYINKGWWEDQYDNLVGMSQFFHGSPELLDRIEKYIKGTYGLSEREGDVALINYNSRMRNKIQHTDPHNKSELTESENYFNTFTDDKDFPFLNKLANHAMKETVIGKNAIIFAFNNHYASNNNFHRYFDGVPFDQLPFESSVQLDHYLKQFGLTENEKEIWWDIYVVKVRDAVDERDLKIIDNYGELNESTGDIYEKIANSVVGESNILEQEGKLYLRSPAFDGGVNVEIVLDILTTPGKRPIPLAFAQHMKNIYNIEKKGYNTVIQTVWRLYRDKMIKKIKDAKERLSIPRDNVLDRIAHSMYKESTSTPDSFPFDSTSMSFDDYVKNMYGISDEEADYVYREFRHLKGWSKPDPYLPDPLNEQTFVDDIEDPIYEKIANSIANESEIVISPSPYNKMFLRSPAWKEAQHIENVIDQLTGGINNNTVPDRFVKHLKDIFNIKYPTFVYKVWELYRDKMIERIKIKEAQLRQIPPKQQKFFDHIIKTLVDETEVQTMKDWLPDDETYEQKVWVTPPFLTHGIDVPRYEEGSVEWGDFSYFGYGYARYMKDIYGLTDKEGLKLWAIYYKALQKKVEELIERDRIIYGDD